MTGRKSRGVLLAACTIVLATTNSLPSAAATMSALYSFLGEPNDGGVPQAGLTAGTNGELYGVTFVGGANNVGTVFELTPPTPPSTRWREAVLHVFAQDDSGYWPNGGLLLGADGTLYGATTSDAVSNCGVIFALRPPVNPRGVWKYSVLHRLVANDGCDPRASLIVDDAGALYGTASSNGAGGNGTVFRLTPPASTGRWTFNVLYALPQSGEQGIGPEGGLVFGNSGELYGTTAEGGASSGCASLQLNCGVVFKLSPPGGGHKRWQYALLHTFSDAEGTVPLVGGGALVRDQSGALYGTTTTGGHVEGGTVFQLAPPVNPRGVWKLRVLRYLPTESSPNGLLLGADGALYGTTFAAGRQGHGVAFKLTPTQTAHWTYSLLWQFNNARYGNYPMSTLIADDSGALYGTASAGGPDDDGTVFKLTQ